MKKRKPPPRIANELFRQKYYEYVENGELNLGELALRMGITVRNKPDATRVGRLLGINKTQDGKTKDTVKHEEAVALCRALHIDPWEAGL